MPYAALYHLSEIFYRFWNASLIALALSFGFYYPGNDVLHTLLLVPWFAFLISAALWLVADFLLDVDDPFDS